ncbi:uncharacterized protein LOC132694622 isoform X2 [Panthera onca]|uniref:uncharacterized protein LOC132694622 isoform X2 n=1 Tax=Panthera onca TaxID=9690 RepID=UPI0029553EE9|nr:uncharacterized protein LOC132694622 isoform X2 [Panthera onca]
MLRQALRRFGQKLVHRPPLKEPVPEDDPQRRLSTLDLVALGVGRTVGVETSILFFKVAAPIYIPTNEWLHQLAFPPSMDEWIKKMLYIFGDIFRISSMVVMENVGQQKLYEMESFCQNITKLNHFKRYHSKGADKEGRKQFRFVTILRKCYSLTMRVTEPT